jgi:nitroreductase
MSTDYDALQRLLQNRYSCRGFKPDPVPRDTITAMFDAARLVPSWCNAQPWQVILTSGSETDAFRQALFDHAGTSPPSPDVEVPTGYSGVYQERRRTCGWQLYEAVGVEKGDRAGSAAQMMRNFSLFEAPHCAIIHSPRELGPYGALDCGAFLLAITLAAQALGVATIPQAAVASHSGFLRDYFDIGDDRLILCAVSFGFEDAAHPANGFRTERAPVADLLDWRG